MDKNPITKIQDTEDSEPKKTKKNKHETVCSDKRRRYGACGICGSENLVLEGVDFCNICGEEVHYITEGNRLWAKDVPDLTCNCKKPVPSMRLQKINHKKHWLPITVYVRDTGLHRIIHCLDCGAVKRMKCPACGLDCWIKDFQYYCKHCGYRSS